MNLMRFWADVPCFCDKANDVIGGAHTICGSCFYNRRKQAQHIVFFAKTKSGQLFIRDVIGRPRVKRTISNRTMDRNTYSEGHCEWDGDRYRHY